MVASKLAVARSRESGEKATLRTVRLWHSSRVPHPVHWSPTLVHNLTYRRESKGPSHSHAEVKATPYFLLWFVSSNAVHALVPVCGYCLVAGAAREHRPVVVPG